MEENLEEEMGGMAMGNGGIAGAGVNQDGSAYNAGGNPTNKFGEPPGFAKSNLLRRKISLLNRPNLMPNTKKGKPLRNILDPDTPIGRA